MGVGSESDIFSLLVDSTALTVGGARQAESRRQEHHHLSQHLLIPRCISREEKVTFSVISQMLELVGLENREGGQLGRTWCSPPKILHLVICQLFLDLPIYRNPMRCLQWYSFLDHTRDSPNLKSSGLWSSAYVCIPMA